MKIKHPHKITPENYKPSLKPDQAERYDPIFEWDNLCKNVKSFWEDLFEDTKD